MSQIGTGSKSIGRQLRSAVSVDHETASIASSRYDSEWEAKEELQRRELDEARARASQMEKTMRWWSDCTANWREKWSKVRSERNKAREEAKVLRVKLESCIKDCSILRRERQELESENSSLRKEMECLRLLVVKKPDNTVEKGNNTEEKMPELRTIEYPHSIEDMSVLSDSVSTMCIQEGVDLLQGAILQEEERKSTELQINNNGIIDKESEYSVASVQTTMDLSPMFACLPNDMTVCPTCLNSRNRSNDNCIVDDSTEQRSLLLHLRLEEANKTLAQEREEKSHLTSQLDKLRGELSSLQNRQEDLKSSRQEALRQLLALQAAHQDQMHSLQMDLQDEASSRENMDKRLCDLREQLEQLQAENAAEWGRRERVESEKQILEREVKKLRAQVSDMEAQLDQIRKGQVGVGSADWDLRQVQQELCERKKELLDLRHSHSKLKKVLQDKSTELVHALRRGEQFDAEVRRLRGRVEELKRELANAEDEVDSATNNIRKLQRSNDELQEQADRQQVQIEHMQTRLRSSTSGLLGSRGSKSLLPTEPSDEDSAE